MNSGKTIPLFSVLALAIGNTVSGAVFNLKIVTDASPDYSDMDSMHRGSQGRI